MEMMNPNLYQPSCPKRTFKQPIFASMDDPLSHNASYLDSLHTWEGKLGDMLMIQHLDLWRLHLMRLLQGRRGCSSVLSLQLLEDKQHLGGEDCNIPKFAHSNLEY